MPRRDFKTPFAVSGDQTQIPTDIQPDGSVSIIQGYGPDYQRPTDGSDPLAKTIERNKFNGLMNDVTASIGEIQLYGYAIWSVGMAPYPAEAYVRHADKVWKNTVANNTAEPGSAGSGWVDPASGGVARFTASGTFVVPAGVNLIYVSGCAGGGGGGGGAGSSAARSGGGGGGGAGRSTIKEPISVTPGQSLAVTIGAAGSAGTSGSGNGGAGGTGGNTTLGSLLTLTGGAGGGGGIGSSTTAAGAGGAGGAPGGQWGGDAQLENTGGNGGNGGGSAFGTGGGGGRAGVSSGTNPAGTVGFGFGAGGAGGGGNYSTTSGRAGGPGLPGMPGFLLIEW